MIDLVIGYFAAGLSFSLGAAVALLAARTLGGWLIRLVGRKQAKFRPDPKIWERHDRDAF